MTDERTTTEIQRRIVLKGVTGAVTAGLVSVGASSGSAQETRGGPVILLGLDSELTPDSPDHGTPEEHAAMFDALLDDVTADGEGFLVIGAKPDGNARRAQRYWEAVGDELGESVTFVNGADGIATVDFADYALLGVASSDYQLEPIGEWGAPPEGLVDEENEALIERSEDLAEFVNAGGGLLGKTQDGLTTPYGYVDPLGEFETAVGIDNEGYVDIEVTAAGESLGLTQYGMSGWCCWHDVFVNYPDFVDVLVYNREAGSEGENDAAAVGGVVVIPVDVAVSIDGPAETEVEDTDTYEVQVQNIGDGDLPEPVRVEFTLSREEEIAAGDAELEYQDEAAEEWISLQLSSNGGTLSATYSPDDGIALSEGDEERFDVRAAFNVADEFTLEADVVGTGDEGDQDHYANASTSVRVDDGNEDEPGEAERRNWPDSCEDLVNEDEDGPEDVEDEFLVTTDGTQYEGLLSPDSRDAILLDLQDGEFAAAAADFEMTEELEIEDDGDVSISLIDGDPVDDLESAEQQVSGPRGRYGYGFYESGTYELLIFAETDTPCMEIFTADDSAGSWSLALEEGADEPPIEITDSVDEREED